MFPVWLSNSAALTAIKSEYYWFGSNSPSVAIEGPLRSFSCSRTGALYFVGPLALCIANGFGLLSSSDGHERISSLEALFPWLCRVLKFFGEGGVAVVGLRLLELLLVIRVGRIQMY